MMGGGLDGLVAAPGFWSEAVLRASAQGAAALAAVWGLCRLLPRLPAPARCWLWRLAYLKLVVALFWATPVDLPLLPAPPPASPAPVARVWHVAPVPEIGVTPVEASSWTTPAGPAPVAPARSESPSVRWGLLALWAAGALFCLARLAGQCRAAAALRQSGSPVRQPEVRAEWTRLLERFRFRREPALLQSDAVRGPLLLDALQPAVVLPAELVDEPEPGALRLMLAHELAHLKRGDLLWSWLPALVHCLFWFHPLVWLANREWRLVQEVATDELAVRAAGGPVADYGAMLVRLAARGRLSRESRLASVQSLGALDESPLTLQRRLKAMKHFRSSTRRNLLLSGCLAVAVAGLILVPYRVTAQAAPADPDEVRVTVQAAPEDPKDSKEAKQIETQADKDKAEKDKDREKAEKEKQKAEKGERAEKAEKAQTDAERQAAEAKRRELEARRAELDAKRRELDEQRRKLDEQRRDLDRELRRSGGRPGPEAFGDFRNFGDLGLGIREGIRGSIQGVIRGAQGPDQETIRRRMEEHLKRLDEIEPRIKERMERARQRVRERLEEAEKENPQDPEKIKGLRRALEELNQQPNQEELRRNLEQSRKALREQLERGPEIHRQALEDVLKQLPQILDSALSGARTGIRAQGRNLTPEQRKELEEKLRRLPEEIQRGLAEGRRGLSSERNVSPELRAKIEEALRRVEERLRTLPEELRKELDAPGKDKP